MFSRGLLAAAMAVALSGCASPLVQPDKAEWQHRAGDARDWQEMAKRTVAAIPLASNGQSYNVYVQPDGTPFGDTYKAYVEEALFARGFSVVSAPEAANITLTDEVHPLMYEPGGKKRITDYASLYTAAAAAGGQLRNISSIDTGLGALAVVGVVTDYLAALNGATDAEVVVTSRITSPQISNFHFIRSETFYVRPADFPLYLRPLPGFPVVPLRVSSR
jgi:hypothetical protein